MRYRALALGSLISLAACNGNPGPSPPTPTEDTGLDSSRPVEFEVTLNELTQRPTPSGLPTRVRITSARMPGPGETGEVTWRALDGDPQRLPRAGPGSLQLTDRRTINITLRSGNTGDQASLVLVGTIEGTQVRGSFTDRLFYPRAGSFLAPIRQR